MTKSPYVLAAFLGSLAFSLKNIGYVLQKKAVNRIMDKRGEDSHKLKDYLTSLSWLLGAAFPFIGALLLMLSYIFAPISFIMPFTGIGLVVLLLFCRYYLKEVISPSDWGAMGAIFAGTLLITLTGQSGPVRGVAFILSRMFSLKFLFFILVPNVSLIFLIASLKGSPLRGMFMGICAGTLGGSALLLQKPVAMLFASYVPGESPLLFLLLILLLVVLLSLGAVLLLNLGYNGGSGIYVTPVYSVIQMLFPVLGGIIVYDEWHALGQFSRGSQSAGLIFILVAIILLSFSQARNPDKEEYGR